MLRVVNQFVRQQYTDNYFFAMKEYHQMFYKNKQSKLIGFFFCLSVSIPPPSIPFSLTSPPCAISVPIPSTLHSYLSVYLCIYPFHPPFLSLCLSLYLSLPPSIPISLCLSIIPYTYL